MQEINMAPLDYVKDLFKYLLKRVDLQGDLPKKGPGPFLKNVRRNWSHDDFGETLLTAVKPGSGSNGQSRRD